MSVLLLVLTPTSDDGMVEFIVDKNELIINNRIDNDQKYSCQYFLCNDR